MTDLDFIMVQHGWTRHDLDKAAEEISENREVAAAAAKGPSARGLAFAARLFSWLPARRDSAGMDTGPRAV